MTLPELKALALAATPGADHAWFSPTRREMYAQALVDLANALPPERVLAMIAVIEAADAMRADKIFGTAIPPVTDYDAARAALEAK